MCAEGWLEAAQSYIASKEVDEEWPNSEAHEALLPNVVGCNAVASFISPFVHGRCWNQDPHTYLCQLRQQLEAQSKVGLPRHVAVGPVVVQKRPKGFRQH